MTLVMVTYLVVGTLIILSIVLPWQKALNLGVFILPWAAFELDFGVSILAGQFVSFVLLVRFLVDSRGKFSNTSRFNWLFWFVLWSIGTAIITLNFYAPRDILSEGAFFRNGAGRVLSQGVVLILGFGLVYLIVVRAQTIDVAQLVRSYVYSCIGLAALGYLQVASYFAFSVDVFPIGAFSNLPEEFHRSGLMGSPIGSVLRMSSLGGEPKGLAISLLLGVAALIGFWRAMPRSTLWKWAVLVMLLVAMAFTGSTSGFFGITIFVLVYAVMLQRKNPLSESQLAGIAVVLSIGGFVAYLYLGAGHEWNVTDYTAIGDYTLKDFFVQRTIGRLSLDDTDIIIMSSMFDNLRQWIMGRGLGLSHVGAEAFLPYYYLTQGYYFGQIINPKSGVSAYGGAGGMVGLVLMSFFMASLVRLRNAPRVRIRSANAREIIRMQALALAIFTILLNRIYSADVSWVLIAICGLYSSALIRTVDQPLRTPRRS